MDDTKKNALAVLAERLDSNEVMVVEGDEFPIRLSINAILDFRKARRIVAELAKMEQPIDLRTVGMTHLADILEADKNRAVEIVRNCRAIAEEGAGDGK